MPSDGRLAIWQLDVEASLELVEAPAVRIRVDVDVVIVVIIIICIYCFCAFVCEK